MCVKECLHTFLPQINQINKIEHGGNAQKRQKHDLRVISMENRVFR